MNAELDDADKLAEGRMQRKALLFIWTVIGVVGLGVFLYGQAVLQPGVESTELQKWGISLMSGSFFMAVLFNFILRRAMHEDKNAGDHVLILLFKILFFPFVIADGNPLIMGVMVGVAYWITTLEFHPVLTVSAQVFTALYGLGLIFMLWGCLLGWLMSLREGDDGS